MNQSQRPHCRNVVRDQNAPLHVMADPCAKVISSDAHGGVKALWQQAAQAESCEHGLISGPRLIVGPHHPRGCFTWWAWTLLRAERANTGVHNINGPSRALTIKQFLQTARDVLQPSTNLVWVDEAFFLQDQGVAAWGDLPVRLPTDASAVQRRPTAQAQATGLTCRP